MRKITKKECLKESKKYKTRGNWFSGSRKTYDIARKNGWLEECCKHMIPTVELHSKPRGSKWTKEACINKALMYKTKSEWAKASPRGSYDVALKNNWMKECCNHMIKTSELISKNSSKWTKQQCKEEALKYIRKIDWRLGHSKTYNSALYNGWMEDCCKHMMSNKESQSMSTRTKWTKEKCLNEAKLYNKRSSWFYNSKGGYAAASRKGWIEECCIHMLPNSQVAREGTLKWTKDKCLKESLKYKTKNEWIKKSPGSYFAAKRDGFFNICIKHMPNNAVSERKEEKCYRSYIKLFKKLNIKFESSKVLSKRSVIDFVISFNAESIGIEVKHDNSKWSGSEINRQIKKYKKDGKKHNINKILLTSPRGKYGCSLKELKNALLKQKISNLL